MSEPVFTGALRMEIYGDRERGIAFSHRARAQLGLLLAYSGVNERIAAGEPGGFFHSNHTYAGGVTIQTLTNNGQHTARIVVPPLPAPPPQPDTPPKEREEELREFLICGYCHDDGAEETTRYATFWRSQDDVISLGFLPGGFWAEALDISEDGSTIVGFCRTFIDGSTRSRAFRWTLDTGMVELPAMNTDNPNAAATGVSADGTVICGYARPASGGGVVAFVWTAADGMLALDDEGHGAVELMYRISPSGQYITGLIGTTLADNNNIQGALWTRAEGGSSYSMQRVPAPGTSSIVPDFSDQTLVRSDYSYPHDVTDAGVVIGYSTHLPDAVFLPSRTVINSTLGFHSDNTDNFPYSPLERINTVFRWDSAANDYTRTGDNYGEKIADDDGTVIGNSNLGEVITTHTQTVSGDEAETTTTDLYLTFIAMKAGSTSGWYQAPGEEQVFLGQQSFVYDISEDGEMIVGAVDTESTTPLPYGWLRGVADVELALLDGTQNGRAYAVANPVSVSYTEPDFS